MPKKVLNEAICLKQFIAEKEYKEISQLEKLCYKRDKTNLKLEIDYKLKLMRDSEMGLKEINEFLYYVDDLLVAYLGISSFGGTNIGEINGMTHPDFRKNGLFKKLFELVVEECQKRNFSKLLLLSDDNSKSGVGFISFVSGEYDFSEYRMRLLSRTVVKEVTPIRLIKAGKLDGKDIAGQNSLYFNHSEECVCSPENEEDFIENTYMIELNNRFIGKIVISYDDNSAFISGFKILPDFRGKGYGKAALREALCLINEKNIFEIELDVECNNSAALNLYKACGFEEVSVMNYYKYNIGCDQI